MCSQFPPNLSCVLGSIFFRLRFFCRSFKVKIDVLRFVPLVRFHAKSSDQVVLVQLELKLIHICYIQGRYIRFCLKSVTWYKLKYINVYVKWFQHLNCISSTWIKTNTNSCAYLVYNKVWQLCQFFCCGGKANLVRITLFYSTLLTLTDRQTNRQTEKQIHSLRVGWRNLFSFPVVLLCQFFVLVGNRLWFYILLMYLGVP